MSPPVDAPPATDLARSFAAATADPDAFGARFYATLFALDPSARELFPAGMVHQRRQLVDALATVVRLVDDPDRLGVHLRTMGREGRTVGVGPHHYPSAGTALLSTLRHRCGPAWSSEVEGAWTRVWAVVADGMAAAAAAETGPATYSATVVEHRLVADGVAVVRLESPVAVPRRAGQHLRVQVPQRPREWRLLSPATAAADDLEVHVRAVPGGWVSPAIVRHTRVGDTWRLGPARGLLAVQGGRDVLMVAGGTGLAPLRSLVLELARRGDVPRVHLFVGARTRTDLHDLVLLQQVAAANPWLTVVPVAEDEPRRGVPTPCVEGGHAVQRGTLADVVTAHGSWADRQVLLSGSPAMVRATLAAMLRRGTPAENISWDPLPPT